MEHIKRLRGVYRHPQIQEQPVPITEDPVAMPGAMVLGSDGMLRFSVRETPSTEYRWRSPKFDFSVEDDITVFVDSEAPAQTYDQVVADPPVFETNPVNNLQVLSAWANNTLDSYQTLTVVMKPGIYNPESTWQVDTRFLAVDSNWAIQYPGLSAGTPTTPNDSFPILDSKYGDYTKSVNFVPWSVNHFPQNNDFDIDVLGRTITFQDNGVFVGGFNFLSIPTSIKLVKQAIDGRLPAYLGWLTPAWFSGEGNFLWGNYTHLPISLASAYTEDENTNVDTFLLSIKQQVGRGNRYNCTIRRPAIEFNGGADTIRLVKDCVFGSVLPGRNFYQRNQRASYILSNNAQTLTLTNIALRGNTKVTSDGVQAPFDVFEANTQWRGTAPAPAPWTWTQHCPSFVSIGGLKSGSPNRLTLWLGEIIRYVEGAGASLGKDRTGKWLPNSIFLLDNNGVIATTLNGPFLDSVFLCKEVRIDNSFGDALSFTTPPAQFTPPLPYPTRRGWIGAFGSNGHNSTKTRAFVLGMTNATVASERREKGVGIEGRNSSTWATPESSGRPFDAVNSTTSAEGYPYPAPTTGFVVITDDRSGVGLNLGLRDYMSGIGPITTNVILADRMIL